MKTTATEVVWQFHWHVLAEGEWDVLAQSGILETFHKILIF